MSRVLIEAALDALPSTDPSFSTSLSLAGFDFDLLYTSPFEEEQATDDFRDDPVRFAEERLGVLCWSKMQEIMEAIASGKRKILVRSCNGAGKTTAIAALCLWKLTQFPDSIVLTTASSWTQVKRTLWGEIRRQGRRSGLLEGAMVSDTSIRISDKHYEVGISPGIPENAQGFHAPNMLIAVDEATGVSREIIDALSGNATSNDTQLVMICNPIDTHSYPYEAEQSGDWHLITISAMEHPNVVQGLNVIEGAVTRKWIEDRMESWSYEVEAGSDNAVKLPWIGKWYRKSAIVQSRILGEWADLEATGFIAFDLVERALLVEPVPGPLALGVDIARGGEDETVFAFFNGNTQLPFQTFRDGDLMRTADRIQDWFRKGYTSIAIDDTGVGGGVSDRLKQLGVPHHAVNFAARPAGLLASHKDLANARAEMFFLFEEELRRREIRLLDEKLLHQELTATRLSTSEHVLSYRMEDKENVRKRLGRSPDRADATLLARYALHLDRRGKRKLLF